MTNYFPTARFGALPRQHDPAEVKYAYAMPAKAADWSRHVGIPRDFRAPIWSQPNSDCTASICEALESSARLQGRSVPELSHRLVYWLAREYQGWVSRTNPSACKDEGAYLADAARAARAGVGQEHFYPDTVAHWQPPPPEVEADAPNQDWLLADRAIYPGDPGASDMVYDALNRGYTLQIGWVIRSDMYSPDGAYPTGLTPDPFGKHGFHASYLCYAFPLSGTVWGVMPNSWGESFNPNLPRHFPAELVRPGEAVFPLLDWVDRRNSPIFEMRVLDLEPYTQPEPEPDPMPISDYEHGYTDARGQDLRLLEESVAWYRDHPTSGNNLGLRICQWHLDRLNELQPERRGAGSPRAERPADPLPFSGLTIGGVR